MNGFALLCNILCRFSTQIRIGHILLKQHGKEGYTHKTS